MARGGAGRLHGFLIIDKPAGWTSHDVVGRVRRMTGERKVGHAGTLDPAATGVLPVAVGVATRTLEFLTASSKTYLAEITFGVRTDSHDVDGTVCSVHTTGGIDAHVLNATLETFRGKQLQMPPMHSAIKVGGRRLYELARQGTEIERNDREIDVHEINLVEWSSPVATVCVDCSKGTYIRAIARDIGERLGCGAYLSNLVRVRTGPFSLDDAWALHELAALDLPVEWPSVAVHPDVPVEQLPGIVLDPSETDAWGFGRSIASQGPGSGLARIYNGSGSWLGVARYDSASSKWQPYKVVGEAA